MPTAKKTAKKTTTKKPALKTKTAKTVAKKKSTLGGKKTTAKSAPITGCSPAPTAKKPAKRVAEDKLAPAPMGCSPAGCS